MNSALSRWNRQWPFTPAAAPAAYPETSSDWQAGYLFPGRDAVELDFANDPDLDVDSQVTIIDLVIVAQAFGTCEASPADVDNSGGPDGSSSSAKALVEIDAVNVIVAENGRIEADADVDNRDNENEDPPSIYTGNADADVDITASGVVVVDGLVKAEADVYNRDGWDSSQDQQNFPGDL